MPPLKRKRAVGESQVPHHRSKVNRQKTPPSFYDDLSKLPLCPRVLREFDRRTPRALKPQPLLHRRVPSAALSSLARFARRGGPNLDNLVSYTAYIHEMVPCDYASTDHPRYWAPQTSDSSIPGAKPGACDPAFQQHLEDHGVYMPDYEHVPANLNQIRIALRRRRASLSVSAFAQDRVQSFCQLNQNAKTEAEVMSTCLPIITGNSTIPNGQNIPFNHLAPLTNRSAKDAQPDFYDGVRPRDLAKLVRDELGDLIVPSTSLSNPLLPNFFLEGKGEKGSARVSQLQTCYDGALGARAMHALRWYVDPETPLDNNAYVISATYIGGLGGGVLNLFSTHAVRSQDPIRPVKYYMTKLGGWDMTGDDSSFREGASALRNAREWAQEERTKLVAAANAKASTLSVGPRSVRLRSQAGLQRRAGRHTPTPQQELQDSRQTGKLMGMATVTFILWFYGAFLLHRREAED